MSITGLILDRMEKGMLFPVLPRAKGTTIRRAMLVTEELHAVLESPTGDLAWEERVANLKADLEVFVDGRTIDPKYLFLLYPSPDAVWEIRSVRDNPSIRVLGLFAAKDVFIATNFAYREELGGWQSREWKAVKRRAAARWRVLFHTYTPQQGTDAQMLVTGALNGVYFKTS